MTKVEEIEARRAARQAELAKAEAAQYELDLEARDALEVQYGDGAVAGVKIRFKAGFPTRIFLRTPKSVEYKRYVDKVGRAAANKGKTTADHLRAAQEELARACWVYPKEPEQREAVLEEFPGLLSSIVLAATTLAEGQAEEEGKG